MKKLIFLFLVLSCTKDDISVKPLDLTIVEINNVFSKGENIADVYVSIFGVDRPLEEVGLVWGLDTISILSKKSSSAIEKVTNNMDFFIEIDKLESGKKYFIRPYFKLDGEVKFGSETSFIQIVNTKWRRESSPNMLENELMDYESVFRDLVNYDGLKFTKFDKKSKTLRTGIYIPDFQYWDFNNNGCGNYSGLPFRHNLLQAPISVGKGNKTNGCNTAYRNEFALLTGLGHYKNDDNEKFFLNDFTIIGVDGYKWLPEYPGAQVETVGFGFENSVFVLENTPKGALWSFTLEENLAWKKRSVIPINSKGKLLGKAIGSKAYIILEPDEDIAQEFWQYDISKNQWKNLGGFPGTHRRYGALFLYKNTLYYGMGQSINKPRGLRDIWQYDETQNTWTLVMEYPGSATVQNVAIEYKENLYIGFGKKLAIEANNGLKYAYKNDFWAFNFDGLKKLN